MRIDELKMYDKVHKILIVDDEKEVLEALRSSLECADKFKSEISLAEDAKTALIKLKKHDYDLILSDYKMPKMDGVEVLEKDLVLKPTGGTATVMQDEFENTFDYLGDGSANYIP